MGLIASFMSTDNKRPKRKYSKLFFRIVLQARIWHRHHLNNQLIGKAVFVSTCKWMCNLGGLFFLFFSMNLSIANIELLLAACSYNFLAIIPIQTIGGFGVTEAGLTGILTFFDLDIESAASVSILSRLVLIFIPFLFFLLVYSYNQIQKNETDCR